MDNHNGEGNFPFFKKCTEVSGMMACEHTEHWFSCVIEGHETYVPETFIAGNELARDYDPTELVIEKGKTVVLLEVVFTWLYVENEDGRRGWVPAGKVVSI